MELRHLNTFVQAAEHASFTGAARSLGLTQAAVSQHIAALENEFGLSLFERSSRKVRLTPAGQTLLDYAQRILDLLDQAKRDITDSNVEVTGTLRIASSSVPAEWLLPELIAEFRKRYPKVIESVHISDSTIATQAVTAGEADVGFVGELPRSSQLTARAIAEDELVLVVSARHPLAKKRSVTVKDLRKEAFVVREPGSGSRRCVEQALEAAGLPPSELTVAIEVNSNEAIRTAVTRGAGVAFLSSRSFDEQRRRSPRIVPLKTRNVRPKRRLYVLTNSARVPSAILRTFLAFLEDIRPASSPKRKA